MFTTFSLSLKALLNDVQSGKIQLPDFQRGWVWDEDRIKGLLASISRGFPVGAVMTLSAGGDIRFRTRLVEGVSGRRQNQRASGQRCTLSLKQHGLKDSLVGVRPEWEPRPCPAADFQRSRPAGLSRTTRQAIGTERPRRLTLSSGTVQLRRPRVRFEAGCCSS